MGKYLIKQYVFTSAGFETVEFVIQAQSRALAKSYALLAVMKNSYVLPYYKIRSVRKIK